MCQHQLTRSNSLCIENESNSDFVMSPLTPQHNQNCYSVKSSLASRRVLTCSGQRCGHSQGRLVSSLLSIRLTLAGWQRLLNPSHPTPPPLSLPIPPPVSLKCLTWMLLCRLVEWVGGFLSMTIVDWANRSHCFIVPCFMKCYIPELFSRHIFTITLSREPLF